METLSIKQARKLALHSQRLPSSSLLGLSGTHSAIEQLGYIQIDSISVASRAHHHVLWSRVKNYRPEHIDKLLKQGKIFEYWSHAAAYLPMEDFRFSLPRKARIASDQHWFKRDKKVEQEVLARIRAEGPLQTKDFQKPQDHEGGWWQWKPAKQALEQLFMAGELMCPYRNNFQKVYNLTERVLPTDIDTTMPSAKEFAQYLIQKSIQSHGLVQLGEIGYLRKGLGNSVKDSVNEMVEDGVLLQVQVGELTYLTNKSALALLNKPLSQQKLSLLSPFDNLIIQRKRIQQLFGFDYRIECYVPAEKREFGYYALPILWCGELIGKTDVKAERSTGIFHINRLAIDDKVSRKAELFTSALVPVLRDYASFNGCNSLAIHDKTHKNVYHLLENAFSETADR